MLECSVWDFDVRGCNDFIGCIRLGPDPEKFEKEEWMDSYAEEVTQWEDMLAKPGEWVEREHTLRPTIGTLNPSEANGVEEEAAPLDDQSDLPEASSTVEQTTPPLDQHRSPMASIMDTVDRPVSEEEEEKASDDVSVVFNLRMHNCIPSDYSGASKYVWISCLGDTVLCVFTC